MAGPCRPLTEQSWCSTAPSNLYTYWTIDPFNRFTLWWRVFITVLDATYTALYLPISVAWHYDLRYFRWFNVLDFAGGKPLLRDCQLTSSRRHCQASRLWLFVHALLHRQVCRAALLCRLLLVEVLTCTGMRRPHLHHRPVPRLRLGLHGGAQPQEACDHAP